MLEMIDQLATIMPTALEGRLVQSIGLTAAVAGLRAPLGAVVEIERQNGTPAPAEVIGFRDDLTLLYPLGDLTGVRHGNRVRLRRTQNWLRVGPALLGRVINARGEPLDGKPRPTLLDRVALDNAPPSAMDRPRITRPFSTGVRAIDGLLTCGRGQRMGIFAGSGVGKSVTMGMLARHAAADVNVIALIGERGREVNEFLARDLGAEGLSRSVVVVATSDEPALLRTRAALTATAIAEYFRDSGGHVIMLMDSLTRFALAQREIGLAAGEPPTTRGYPPSVFSMLPKLLERAGCSSRGSITAFYSVLVEADDPHEPISDALRSLLDGHTWLSRKLASSGHYPAIDPLESVSRLFSEVTTSEHAATAREIRELLAAYRAHEDLISIGAYQRGANRQVDAAIELLPLIQAFLRQRVDESSTVDSAAAALATLRELAQKQVAGGER